MPETDPSARPGVPEPSPGETMPAPATVLPVPAGQFTPMAARLGRYEVASELGRGGMGVVYHGHDPALDRAVALKVLSPALAQDPGFRARFLSEARSMAKIEHGNVVRVYDVGEESGQPFFAMEFIDGQPADQLVKKDGPLSVADALGIVRQAALGLAAAQAQGILHRDVKPSNLMLEKSGKVKVLDFGLAKLPGGSQTAADVVMGTPEYMSPEQGRGEAPDHRSDIYALGATLWYFLAGSPPFTGNSALAIIQKQINDPLPPIDTVRKDVPESVRALLGAMLDKRPDGRPPDHTTLVALIDASIGAPRTGSWPAPLMLAVTQTFKRPDALLRPGALDVSLATAAGFQLKVAFLCYLTSMAAYRTPVRSLRFMILVPLVLASVAIVTWILTRLMGGRSSWRRHLVAETAVAGYLPVLVLPSVFGLAGLIAMARARWLMLRPLGVEGGKRAAVLVLSALVLLNLLLKH